MSKKELEVEEQGLLNEYRYDPYGSPFTKEISGLGLFVITGDRKFNDKLKRNIANIASRRGINYVDAFAYLVLRGIDLENREAISNKEIEPGSPEWVDHIVMREAIQQRVDEERTSVYNKKRRTLGDEKFIEWCKESGINTDGILGLCDAYVKEDSFTARAKEFLNELLKDVPYPGLPISTIKDSAIEAEFLYWENSVLVGWNTFKSAASQGKFTKVGSFNGEDYWCHPNQRINKVIPLHKVATW